MNLAVLVKQCVQRYGPEIALHDLTSGARLTFNDILSGVEHVAASLEALAILRGSRVALLGGSNAKYLLCDYGVIASGRVRVPLDPSLNVDEQLAQILDANVRLVIYSNGYASRAAALMQRHSSLIIQSHDEILSRPERATLSTSSQKDSDLASLSFTGGTTGSPKAVMITHGGLTSTVQSIVAARDVSPGDIMLNVRPAWPIAAVVLLAHLAAGGTILLGDRFDPRDFMKLLQEYRVNITSLVPTHLARLMGDLDPRDYDIEALRAIDVGAAAIPEDLLERLLTAFGPRIGILYGLTEAPWSCYLPPTALALTSDQRQERMRSVGRPVPGVEVCSFSTDGKRLTSGIEGEICIRGNHIMAGYWQRPEETNAALRNGWFHTGDYGVVDIKGYVYITGRIKDVVRTGGKSVLPAEVESILLTHPAVQDAVVLGLPDPEWGEIVVAAVVLYHDVVEPPSEVDLIDWCREKLSSFKKPRRVYFIDEIPRSHYGKALRARVRERLLVNDR